MSSKISAILLAISQGDGRTVTEIAAWSGLPLSTVHRLVGELAAWGLLQRDDDGRYRAGLPLRALGAGVASPPAGDGHLRDHVAPVVDDLFRTTAAQVRVGWLDGTSVAYVEKARAHAPTTQPSAAARLPAHATALGKTLLAFSPAHVVDSVVSGGLRRFTPSTIARPAELRRVFRTVRATRIALCDRELDERWCGVAAPVFGPGGTVLAAIELRADDLAHALATMRAPLAVAAACLSRDLTACTVAGARPDSPPLGHRNLVALS